MLDRWLSWVYVRRIWGPRCSEYEAGCPCCEKWLEHDWHFGKKPAA